MIYFWTDFIEHQMRLGLTMLSQGNPMLFFQSCQMCPWFVVCSVLRRFVA